LFDQRAVELKLVGFADPFDKRLPAYSQGLADACQFAHFKINRSEAILMQFQGGATLSAFGGNALLLIERCVGFRGFMNEE
jgi:hypothetical protein